MYASFCFSDHFCISVITRFLWILAFFYLHLRNHDLDFKFRPILNPNLALRLGLLLYFILIILLQRLMYISFQSLLIIIVFFYFLRDFKTWLILVFIARLCFNWVNLTFSFSFYSWYFFLFDFVFSLVLIKFGSYFCLFSIYYIFV